MSEESTTPDLAELARRAVEAASRHDLDGVMSFFAPEAVLDRSALGHEVCEGEAAICSFLAGWWAMFADHVIEPEENAGLGHGVLLSQVRELGRLAWSDRRVDQRWHTTSVWLAGKIAHYAIYTDYDEARAAAERSAEEPE